MLLIYLKSMHHNIQLSLYNVYCNFPLNISVSFTDNHWLFYWIALNLNFITLKNITLNRLNSYKLYLHVINH